MARSPCSGCLFMGSQSVDVGRPASSEQRNIKSHHARHASDCDSGYVGLDQINLRIPRSLAGSGEAEVKVMIDGQSANPVRINIK